MSGVSLNKFNQVQDDHRVTLDGNNKVQTETTGTLFGRTFKVRTDVEKQENKEVTKQFFQSLRDVYGDRVTDWAIQGYESRIDDGKPLTGYRIQQIIARAQSIEDMDGEALERLVGERAPSLLDDSLKRAGIQLPEKGREEWQKLLTGKVESEIRNSDKFKDPRKLETSSFVTEFQGVVDKFVEDHKEALSNLVTFEDRRQQMLAKPEEHGSWGKVRPQDLDKEAFPRNCRRDFVEGFGTGDDKIGDFEEYWTKKIIEPAELKLERTFGSRQDFSNYDKFFSQDSTGGHDEVYSGSYTSKKEFIEFSRLDHGIKREQTGDEKFHISVRPEDISRAYSVLAPILLREDCPIAVWKVANVEGAQRSFETALQKLNDLEDGKTIEYQGAKYSKQTTDENTLNTVRDQLTVLYLDGKRLYDNCQFTLYPLEGEESGKFTDILDEIEQALHGAGIEPLETPLSDEGVNDFVSFRVHQQHFQPGDPRYQQVAREAGGLDIYGNNIDFENPTTPVRGRIDPFDEGYPEIRDTFTTNPFFQGQVVNLTSTEINRLRQGIDDLDDNPQTLSNLVGQARALREKVDSLELTDGQRARLEERLDRLDQQVREHVGAPLTGLVSSHFRIEDNDVAPEFGEAMDRVRNNSSFDDTTGTRLEQLLSLAGKLKTGAMVPGLGFGERLQLSTDMQALRREFDLILDTEYGRLDQETEVDMPGKNTIDVLRRLDFGSGLDGLRGGFRTNGEALTDDEARTLENAVRGIGVAGSMMSRELELDNVARTETRQHIAVLEQFIEDHEVTDDFQPSLGDLKGMMQELTTRLDALDRRDELQLDSEDDV